MQSNILLLHGPNLNLLGKRDRKNYGTITLEALENLTIAEAKKFNFNLRAFQSNYEGKLIDLIQENTAHCCGIIINLGAFTHYSYALYDALLDTKLPIVEVHLSKISNREPWRRISVTAPLCIKVIEGKKELGYIEAVKTLIEHLSHADH
ncbi:MAG: hypothetical protein A3F18_01695 [Legionellales bacterium RIFCSPHIGHO2_12_FULL_37_14]|nr:MAG: hypothetical protein A3F18_01695 [Legionellales bacterium RIFCSPHIGHO2_12_FULL_37_14]